MCLFPKHAYTLLAESVSVRVHVQTCLPRVVHQTCNSTHVPAYVVASSCSFRGSTACEVRIQIPDNQTQKLSVSLFGLGLASSSPNFDKSNDADGVQGSTKVLVRIESVGSSERVCTAADEPGGWVRQKVAAVWGMKGSVWGPVISESKLGFGVADSDESSDERGKDNALIRIHDIRSGAFDVWAARVRQMCPAARVDARCSARGDNIEAEECGGHGRCDVISGWCFCYGDWFGDNCAHHLFLNR